MIKLKRAHDKIPINVALKPLELKNEVLIAIENRNLEKLKELEECFLGLEIKVKDATPKMVRLLNFLFLYSCFNV
jgi:hypothetical protein